jgi:magnesium-transporting ATPase (P-type)
MRDLAGSPDESPTTAPLDGLDELQVRERIARGEVNAFREPTSRSLWKILRANVMTRFNALLGALLAVMLWVGPPQDALFGISILLNTLIGIVQELRAKRTLDRLVVVSAPMARVVRSGGVLDVAAGQIVMDDVLDLYGGDQIPVDGIVLSGKGLEVDESLLTGESSPVPKGPGDAVLSGSSVLAGSGRVRATRVGPNSYGRKLATAARQFSLARSGLRAGIDTLLAWVTWLLVPTGTLVVVRQLLPAQAGWRDAVRGSVAVMEGMVPQGLVLLTSVALAAAALRLGRQRVLVQELSAVELLARVDVVCLDKTGTLTTGESHVERLVPLAATGWPAASEGELGDALAVLSHVDGGPGPSVRAIARRFPAPLRETWPLTATVPFSSTRKWTAVTASGRGTWLLGAPDAVFGSRVEMGSARQEASRLAATGRQVLALARAASPLAGEALPPDLVPAALVALTETIRVDASATLRFFEEQGVAAKVISGDDPQTVAAIAGEVGIPRADATRDGGELPADPDRLADDIERHAVFGRVTPERKREMIAALRRRGHVVAMIGDGLNDILALKEADLGIAVRTAAPATRAVAKVVLLDGFSCLPSLVDEGRQVIANIERTANLFITKVCYVFLLAVAVSALGIPFPLLPRHLTLASAVTIGVPAFFLSLLPNRARVFPGFARRVLRFALPAGAVVAVAALAAYVVTRRMHPGDLSLGRTTTMLVVSACGLTLLQVLRGPTRFLRYSLVAAMTAGFAVILLVQPTREFFALALPGLEVWETIGAATAVVWLLLHVLLSGLKASPRR